MKLLLLLLAAVVHGHNYTDHQYKHRYNIFNQYNSEPITHDYPAYVELSVTPTGDLRVDVGAPFFNSPNQAERFAGKCPANPYYHYELYQYNEVIEVLFATGDGKFFQLDVTPRGQYVAALLDGRDTTALTHLSLAPYAVEVHNPCFPGGGIDGVLADCDRPWSATVVIPRAYLPANIKSFNAHYVHGAVWGEVVPSKFFYESVYPSLDYKIAAATSRAGEFNRHQLGSFRNIEQDLADIGYVQQTTFSDIWKNATEKKDFTFTYDVFYTHDCAEDIKSNDYKGEVVVRKSAQDKKVYFHVKVNEKQGVKPYVPENLRTPGFNKDLGFDYESFYFNYRGFYNESLRFGVNPYGAYVVQFRNDVNDVVVGGGEQTFKLENPVFLPAEVKDSNWEATFAVPYEYFPREVYSFQFVHFHRSLADVGVEGKPTVASPFDFVGAVCPGFSLDVVDWRGCGFDHRFVIDKEFNTEYSQVWKDAVGVTAVPLKAKA